jgi:hypothetical protein
MRQRPRTWAHSLARSSSESCMVSGRLPQSGLLRLVATAVRYWAAYPGEVDAEIGAAEAAEDAAEQAWLRERQLLAG